MDRPAVTNMLGDYLEKYIDPHNDPRIYWAKEVTFDYATEHSCRVDYMVFKPHNNSTSGIEKGDFYCYEIKSSVEDFRSPNGHNFIGDFNYYVMPMEVYDAVKESMPFAIGVLIPTEKGLKSVRRARRKDRDKPISEMLLMMWRSSRREIVKVRKRESQKESDGKWTIRS